MRLKLLLVCGIALAFATAALGSDTARKPLAVKVAHLRIYYDKAGVGKGELLVRVWSDYGRRGLKGKWWGLTEVTVRGPGGQVEVADIDRLHHPGLGERIDHRMLVTPKAARRLFGKRGLRAHLHYAYTAYLIPIRTPGSARRAACCEDRETGFVNQVNDFAPEQATFGGGKLSVLWTELPPYQPFASSLVLVRGGIEVDEITGAHGILASDGSFDATGQDGCADPATFSGKITPPNADGTWPANASASVSWSAPYNSLGGCGTSGSAAYGIDP